MASFRKGSSAVIAASSRGGSKMWAPIIRFEPGETKYVQFMHPMSEIYTVLMHQFIIVGEREDGSPIYERFISRRDPALDGPKGYDEIWDRFGYPPTERSIAVVLELEPVFSSATNARKKIEGFDIVERQYENSEGDVVTVPNFVLVIESPKTFFTHLAANADVKEINQTVFAVKRTGAGVDTTYTFIDTNVPALDVGDLYEDFTNIFSLEKWLQNLADENRMAELIGPLDDNAKISLYPPRGKTENEGLKASSQSARRFSSKTDDNEEQDEKPKEISRSRRFAELRKQVSN